MARVLLPDPMGHITAGMRTADISGYNDRNHGIWTTNQYQWCAHEGPSAGWACSRPVGHPNHWQHVAAVADRVHEVWGGYTPGGVMADPWAHIQANHYVDDYPGSRDNVTGFRCDNQTWCRETNPEFHTTGAYCTRPPGHVGQHISTNGSRVIWVMPGAATTVEPEDPEDGTPADPDSAVCTTNPTVGDVVRLKDRKNRLYVLTIRTDGVEALDLVRQGMRVVPLDHCIPGQDALSVEELGWVAQWYAQHREGVRRIAVREHVAGRWCSDGLNRNLRDLGMEPYQPRTRGSLVIKVPFSAIDTGMGKTEIERKLSEVWTPGLQKTLAESLPAAPDIELEPAALTLSAADFARR